MLSAFAFQGGIERFNRAFLHAFHLLSQIHKFSVSAAVVYDQQHAAQHYFPPEKMKGYQGQRVIFILREILRIFKDDIWILGHLNLSPIGLIRKLFRPSRPVILVCHGIEVFYPLKGWRSRMLKKADLILAVSEFTKQQLMEVHGVSERKIIVFPNTIDPFFQIPSAFKKPSSLQKRYNIGEHEFVLFTLARMKTEESYKGYDLVLRALPSLLQQGYQIRYVLAGQADEMESKRISDLINCLRLQEHVTLPGFIPEEEIVDHYQLADLFVMPSKGEGFGIVFLEALACGVPVIAGNKDGSGQALLFGKLGILIDPDNVDELIASVKDCMSIKRDPHCLQKDMLSSFSFDQFKSRTELLIAQLSASA